MRREDPGTHLVGRVEEATTLAEIKEGGSVIPTVNDKLAETAKAQSFTEVVKKPETHRDDKAKTDASKDLSVSALDLSSCEGDEAMCATKKTGAGKKCYFCGGNCQPLPCK